MIETLVMLGFVLIGCGTITYGVSQWSGPGGWVTFGCCCLLAAFWPFLRGRLFE